MNPADQLAFCVEIGDRVYVDPQHAETSRKTAGLAGVVDQLEGDSARVIFGHPDDAHAREVPLSVLRQDRRIARRLRQLQGQ